MELGRRIGKIGLYGYAGDIFVQKMRCNYGQQTFIERLWVLQNWFSDVWAYLPVVYHVYDEGYENKKKEYETNIKPLLIDVQNELDTAFKEYDSKFEGVSCNPKEKEYILMLRGIQLRLDNITAMTKLIDKMQADDTEDIQAG